MKDCRGKHHQEIQRLSPRTDRAEPSKDFKTSESKEPRTTEETLVDDSAESGIAQGCTERLQTGKLSTSACRTEVCWLYADSTDCSVLWSDQMKAELRAQSLEKGDGLRPKGASPQWSTVVAVCSGDNSVSGNLIEVGGMMKIEGCVIAQETTAANRTHCWPLASGKLISFCEIILFLRAK